ncbi:hypothetical protein F0562_018651 [Nyssa sinensis]|uniref:Uncharacterized protein n=1 Tax=Nyssa sinensis TaxID=561372 RepID=A0A5J4ZE25_9ASTE|nr:hypothetical protein F0562_018651 [Nyssa sinensis]
MGSEYNPSKPHYNISMSKRTRKPLNLGKEANGNPLEDCSLEKESFEKDIEGVEEKSGNEEGEEIISDHKSLKQLMINGDGEGSKGRSSLGQHFTKEEEKQLQVVVKQHEESLDGVKFKRMIMQRR